jgi:G3E family GTPase
VTEDFEHGAYGTMLRSKGFFQLATRPGLTGIWSQAGAVARFEPAAHTTEAEAQVEGQPHPAQELVFIGTHLRSEALRAALRACLITGGERIAEAEDPFPAWDTGGEHLHIA